jgi:hypothetical protein
MKDFLTPNDLKKIENKKGTILISSNPINMVETKSDEIEVGTSVYTVWNFVDGFIFVRTQNHDEAYEVFKKFAYSK